MSQEELQGAAWERRVWDSLLDLLAPRANLGYVEDDGSCFQVAGSSVRTIPRLSGGLTHVRVPQSEDLLKTSIITSLLVACL